MALFEFLGVGGASGAPFLKGVTAFETVEAGGRSFVLAVSRTGATVLELQGGTAAPASQLVFNAPFLPGAVPTLAPVVIGGGPAFALGGAGPGLPALLQVAAGGALQTPAPPTGWPAQVIGVSSVQGGGGMQTLTLGADGAFRVLGTSTQGQIVEIGQLAPGVLVAPTAVLGLSVGNVPFAAVVEDAGRRLAIVDLAQPAAPAIVSRMGSEDGIGVAGLSGLVAMTILDQTFVVAAGAQSSSLTVFRLSGTGELSFADHVIDNLETRFQSAQALAVHQVSDRVFIFAGGADDGVSGFLLLPDGRLHHLGAVADTIETTLQNVTGLTIIVQSARPVLLVSGEGEFGVTRLGVDTGDIGVTRMAGPSGGTLAGSAADDILVGGTGRDRLEGGSGTDILVDGRGADTLVGGAGADVFVFDDDASTDVILDFQPGVDRIDLSRLPLVFSPDQVTVATTPAGAILTIRDEVIELYSATGAPVTAADLAGSLIVNLSRPFRVPDGLTITGTPGPDTLTGDAGDDTIRAGDGDDRVDGGWGDDLVDGGAGDDVLTGGRGEDRVIGGSGNDLVIGGEVRPDQIDDWLSAAGRYHLWLDG